MPVITGLYTLLIPMALFATFALPVAGISIIPVIAVLRFLLAAASALSASWAVNPASRSASPKTLVFMLPGIGMLLPIMLIYNGYQYYVFRGKVSVTGDHD